MNAEYINLEFRQGSSDKVYNVELTEVGGGWLVNFEYGRRGSALTSGSKTRGPVPYGTAKRTYDKLVSSKKSKGYVGHGMTVATATTTAAPAPIPVAKINTAEKKKSNIYPQLLNELTEKEAEDYISNTMYCMQEKFDGKRRLVQKTPVESLGINKKAFIVALTPEIEGDVSALPRNCILDGEDMGDKIMIFDDITEPDLPYMDRYAEMRVAVKDSEHLIAVETAWTTLEKREMFRRLQAEGAEGVVFKNMNAGYTAGRPASGGDQFKCKFYATASCIVKSVSNVKASIGLAAIDDDGKQVSVGNATVYANRTTPAVGDVVEIKYLYYYPGGSLYQPVLLETRDDVDPEECLVKQFKVKQHA